MCQAQISCSRSRRPSRAPVTGSHTASSVTACRKPPSTAGSRAGAGNEMPLADTADSVVSDCAGWGVVGEPPALLSAAPSAAPAGLPVSVVSAVLV